MTETAIAFRHWRQAVLTIGLVLVLALVAFSWPREAAPPEVQGAILPQPKPLPEFELVAHDGRGFGPAELNGRWHLVSYGFTHCPDICPTTLHQVAQFYRQLKAQKEYTDLQVLFYSVDPGRDTAARLADYVSWFHEDFVGLRSAEAVEARTFATSLGINASVQPADKPENYQVAHGLMLYLLNPQGELRAALKPTRDMDGSTYYEPDRLLADYLAIRRWRDE